MYLKQTALEDVCVQRSVDGRVDGGGTLHVDMSKKLIIEKEEVIPKVRRNVLGGHVWDQNEFT